MARSAPELIMQNASRQFQKGFTLIEMLVVVMIVGILVTLISVLPSEDNFVIDGEARKIANEIRKAQTLALKAAQLQTPNEDYLFIPPGGYGVYFSDSGAGEVKAFVDCEQIGPSGGPPDGAFTHGGSFDGEWCTIDSSGKSVNNLPSSPCPAGADCFDEDNIGGAIPLDSRVRIGSVTDGSANQGEGSVIYRPPFPRVFIAYESGNSANGQENRELHIVLELVSDPSRTRTIVINQRGIVSVE